MPAKSIRHPSPNWFLASLIAVGCATTHSPPTRIDDAQLARLPPSDREALINGRRDVDVARSNLETAKVALKDAEQYRHITDSERSAAIQRLEAARQSVDLARRTSAGDPGQVQSATGEQTLAAQRLDAANAKMAYAESLVALRHRQLELHAAELRLADADNELRRYDRLAASDQAAGLDRAAFLKARDEAQNDLTQRRTAVATGRAAVRSSQQAWNDLHRRFDSARVTADTPAEAPPPPQPID